jgi:hypothetical protein
MSSVDKNAEKYKAMGKEHLLTPETPNVAVPEATLPETEVVPEPEPES